VERDKLGGGAVRSTKSGHARFLLR
jgi:hypothetical protein